MEFLNAVLHILGGAVLSLAIIWNYWLAIPALFVIGFLREQAQHRKQGFFGWITPHRMFEAVQWSIGATISCLVWFFIKN